jgi:hypothetical protein
MPGVTEDLPPVYEGRGGGGALPGGAVLISNARILDWLDDVMKK